jgi:hypothetical protein
VAAAAAVAVSVTAATLLGSPHVTESETVPETFAGIVALKLKLPVALAVPEPTLVPLIDAVTVLFATAPVPLTVIWSPPTTLVFDAVAVQPP